MLSIDEAIVYAREKADKNSVCCDCTSIKDCKTCEQGHKYEQLAEWLEELKAIESDGFTTDLLNMGFTKGYNKAIDDFAILMKEALNHDWATYTSYGPITYNRLLDKCNEIAEKLKEQMNE